MLISIIMMFVLITLILEIMVTEIVLIMSRVA